ncbi:hypothetical protein FXO38_30663 [Capsicum annuum]|nr:hypothetical protein FXO38_30663 [Capsicum annuum]
MMEDVNSETNSINYKSALTKTVPSIDGQTVSTFSLLTLTQVLDASSLKNTDMVSKMDSDLVSGLPTGTIPIYSTPLASMNSNPASWVEMALQGQTITMRAFIKDKDVIFLIQTPELLAYLDSKEMRRAMEIYNAYVWISIVLPNPILVHPLRPVSTTTREIEEALEVMRETRTEISILKDIKVIVFNEKFAKNFILICSHNLVKISLDIRHSFNPEIGNYVLVMNTTMLNPNILLKNSPEEVCLVKPPRLNKSMNLIIWNCREPNNPEFRRNFRSLVDWHKPPRVALLETKMQDHLVLLNDFSFNRVIEVPTIGNAGGLEVLSDDFIVDLSDVAIT